MDPALIKSHASRPGRRRRFILSALAAIALAAGSALGAPPAEHATRVVTYHPPWQRAAKARPRDGSCWTGSIALERADAWRCTVGNAIYDPCFATPRLPGAVICGADPGRHDAGFTVRLTRPLPAARAPAKSRLPWMVRLDDGSVCTRLTGTLPFVGGVVLPLACSDSSGCAAGNCKRMTGLSENFERGRRWVAHKFAYSAGRGGLKLLGRQAVPVAVVWQ